MSGFPRETTEYRRKNADIRSTGRKSRNGKTAVKGIGSKRPRTETAVLSRLRFPRSDFGLHTAGFPRRTSPRRAFPADGKPTVLLSRFPSFAHRPAPSRRRARIRRWEKSLPHTVRPSSPCAKPARGPLSGHSAAGGLPSRPRTPDRQASGRSARPFRKSVSGPDSRKHEDGRPLTKTAIFRPFFPLPERRVVTRSGVRSTGKLLPRSGAKVRYLSSLIRIFLNFTTEPCPRNPICPFSFLSPG